MILQRTMPYDPFDPPPLPGVKPLNMADWLIFDDAFAAQMAERERLLDTCRDEVVALDETGRAAAGELLDLVLTTAYGGASGAVTRRDGVTVAVDRNDPLGTVGRLVQEDMCLLQKAEDDPSQPEHVLTGAVLCFPASWMLAEKFMRPLVRIHEPVASYDGRMATRVQRLFDGVRAGQPMWRFNALWYAEPELHQPRSEGNRRPERKAKQADFLRSERQSILRLPKTKAVVFSIHTFMVARADAMLLLSR